MLRAGTGPKPQRGQKVTVQCTGCVSEQHGRAALPRARAHAAFSRSFGKNNDLKVPFWSTKDPGQQPFSFNIGQGAVIKARQPHCACAAPRLTRARRRGTRAWRRCRLARLLALPPPLTTRESAGARLRGACNRRPSADSPRAPRRSYGAGGFPAWGIMPNSTLIFEIEVLSAK